MNADLLLWVSPFALIVALLVLPRVERPLQTLFFALLPFPLALGGEGGSGNVSVSDVLLFVMLLLHLVQSRPFSIGLVGTIVCVFLLLAGFSSLNIGLAQLALGLGRMGLVTIVPLLLFSQSSLRVVEMRRLLSVFCCSTTVLGIITIGLFVVSGIGAASSPLGINKNAAGPIFGTAVVLTIAGFLTSSFNRMQRTPALVVLALSGVGLLLTLSRGSWVGTAAGITILMFYTRRIRPLILGSILIVPVLVGFWSYLPQERVEYATNFSTDSYVLRTRFDAMSAAMDQYSHNPLFGVGIGLRRIIEPHNVFVLALGETGIFGLAAFVSMIAAAAYLMVQQLRRRNLNEQWPLVLACLSAFAVYHVQTLIDVYWRRGVGALSWACVGMALSLLSSTPVPNRVYRRHSRTAGTIV